MMLCTSLSAVNVVGTLRRRRREVSQRNAISPGGRRGGSGNRAIVGLTTKTHTNPFFVKMKEGATQAAQQAGVQLQSFAGKQDGDNESQVQVIENLISAGARASSSPPTTPRRSSRR